MELWTVLNHMWVLEIESRSSVRAKGVFLIIKQSFQAQEDASPRAKGGFTLSALIGVAVHIKDSPDAKTQLSTTAQVVST